MPRFNILVRFLKTPEDLNKKILESDRLNHELFSRTFLRCTENKCLHFLSFHFYSSPLKLYHFLFSTIKSNCVPHSNVHRGKNQDCIIKATSFLIDFFYQHPRWSQCPSLIVFLWPHQTQFADNCHTVSEGFDY